MPGPGFRLAILRGCSSRSFAVTQLMRFPEPEWGWRSPADCLPPNAAGSGRRTGTAAARDSGLPFRPSHDRSLSPDAMSMRVLIVDDEPSILAAMAPLLRSRGYDVSTALSGRA